MPGVTVSLKWPTCWHWHGRRGIQVGFRIVGVSLRIPALCDYILTKAYMLALARRARRPGGCWFIVKPLEGMGKEPGAVA